MKTAFYELTRAVKKVWGFDPYDGDVESDYIVDGEGSIYDLEKGYVEFKVIGDKFENNYGIDDWDIKITETDGADEILEAL